MSVSDADFSGILALLKNNPRGMSVSEIADAAGLNRNTAARYMDNLLVSGQVEMRAFGKAKVFFLSRRVPVSAMLNLSSEMVMLIDADLKVIQSNTTLLDFLSADAEEIIGKYVYDGACRVFCNDIFTEQIRRSLQGEVIRNEMRLFLNGETKCIEERISPMVLADGKPGVTVVLDDITEKVNAEEALEQSEALFRRLVETVNDVIWSVDDELGIQYISPQVTGILGYLPEELTGKKLSDLMPEDEGKRLLWEMESVVSQENGFSLSDFPMTTKNGHTVYCEFSASPVIVEGEASVFLGYNGAFRDVTSRRNAEIRARRWKFFLDAVIDTIPSLILVADLASGNIVYVNGRVEEYIGYPEEQLTLLTCDECAEELGAAELCKVFAEVRKTHTSSPLFEDVVSVRGKKRSVSARVVYFSLFEGQEYMAAILSDSVQTA